jgi:hypothetical protein
MKRVPLAGLEIDPVADVMPGMRAVEYEKLVADMRSNGQREPVVLHQGRVIDGKHRVKAAVQMKWPAVQAVDWDGDGSLVELVWSLNGVRRHLTPSQLAAVGAEVAEQIAREARERRPRGKGADGGRRRRKTRAASLQADSQEAAVEASIIVGASTRNIYSAAKVKRADPKLFERVKAGKATVNQAVKEVDARAERRRLVKEGKALPDSEAARPLERKAYYEAGSAVLRHVLSVSGNQLALPTVMVLLAGALAETKGTGHSSRPKDGDDEALDKIKQAKLRDVIGDPKNQDDPTAATLTWSEAICNAFVAFARAYVRDLLAVPCVWSAVDALAKHICAHEAQHTWSKPRVKDADRIINAHVGRMEWSELAACMSALHRP